MPQKTPGTFNFKSLALTCAIAASAVLVCVFAFKSAPGSLPADVSSSDTSSNSSSDSSAPVSSSEPEPEPESASVPASSAPAAVVSTDPAPPKPTYLVIDKPGTYASPETYAEIVITCSGVTLQNKTVTGNLFLTDSVGDGDIMLDNIIVDGVLFIYGGGENTVTLSGVSASHVFLQKDVGTVGVLATGTTTVDLLTVKCHAVIKEWELAGGARGFVKILIEPTQKLVYDITLTNIAADLLVANARADIHLSKGSNITALEANTSVNLTGEGTVGTLYAGADNITYETAPGRTVTAPGFRAPVHTGQPPEPAASSESDPIWHSKPSVTPLESPKNLSLLYDSENDRFVAVFDRVSGASGYEIVPMLDDIFLSSLTVLPTENSVPVLSNPAAFAGRNLQFKVRALGSEAGRTSNSGYITCSPLRISQPAAPTVGVRVDTENSKLVISLSGEGSPVGYNISIKDTPFSGVPHITNLGSTQAVFEYPIERTIPGEHRYEITASSYFAQGTGRISSAVSAPVTASAAVLSAPADLIMEQTDDGSIRAVWKNTQSYTELVLVPVLDGTAASAVTLSPTETSAQLLDKNTTALHTSVGYMLYARVPGTIAPPAAVCSSADIFMLAPVPAAKIRVSYLEFPEPGYYAAWDDLGADFAQVEQLEITKIINSADVSRTVVKKTAGPLLLVKKSDFSENMSIGFSVRPVPYKVGTRVPPATSAASVITERMLPPISPYILMYDAGTVRLLFSRSPSGIENVTEYSVIPSKDGADSGEIISILPYRDIPLADFNSRLGYKVRAIAPDSSPLMDSAWVTSSYTADKNPAELVFGEHDDPEKFSLKLAPGIPNADITIKATGLSETLSLDATSLLSLDRAGVYEFSLTYLDTDSRSRTVILPGFKYAPPAP